MIQAADSVTLTTRDLDLAVSPPLPHGFEGTALGYVVALTVTDHHEHQRFVFASDVQGPLSPVAAAWLIQQRPTTLYLSGPPSYIERELGAAAIERAVDHLRRIIDATGCRVIMDHHALRDIRFAARFARLWETGPRGHRGRTSGRSRSSPWKRAASSCGPRSASRRRRPRRRGASPRVLS